MEVNIQSSVNGEQDCTSAVSERPIHVVQRYRVNRGEPMHTFGVQQRYVISTKGRMSNDAWVVGDSNSTYEGMNT